MKTKIKPVVEFNEKETHLVVEALRLMELGHGERWREAGVLADQVAASYEGAGHTLHRMARELPCRVYSAQPQAPEALGSSADASPKKR